MYFLLCIAFYNELKDIKYYPIGLQAFFDLLLCGFSLSWWNFVQLLFDTKSITNYQFFAEIKQWLESTPKLGTKDMYFEFCFPEFLVIVANDYSTCPCILYMAFERFIMVCHPHKAIEWFSNWKRKLYCALLTAFLLLMVISSYTVNHIINPTTAGSLRKDCSKSFYSTPGKR